MNISKRYKEKQNLHGSAIRREIENIIELTRSYLILGKTLEELPFTLRRLVMLIGLEKMLLINFLVSWKTNLPNGLSYQLLMRVYLERLVLLEIIIKKLKTILIVMLSLRFIHRTRLLKCYS